MRNVSAAIVLVAGVLLYLAAGLRSDKDVLAPSVSIAGLVVAGFGLAVWVCDLLPRPERRE